MRVHILSDLHADRLDYQPEQVEADVTVLAGDISEKEKTVRWILSKYTGPVLLVLGNHDYWRGNLDRTLDKLRRQVEGTNITLLEKDSVVLNGVRFLGATAWTDYTLTGNAPLAQWDCQQVINDFRYIRTHATSFHRLRPERLQRECVLTKQWLREQLYQPFEGKTVVVTHHAPSALSLVRESRGGDHTDAAYANRWEDLFGPGLDLWIHGHSHAAVDYELGGTRVVSNPRGYAGEDSGFNPWFVVDL